MGVKQLGKQLTERTFRCTNGKRKRFNTYHREVNGVHYCLNFRYSFFEGEDDSKFKIQVGNLNK